MRYIALITDRNGKTLFTSHAHDTREEAAKEAFAARPKAKRCSTSTAHQVYGGNEWRTFGGNIQWHTKG